MRLYVASFAILLAIISTELQYIEAVEEAEKIVAEKYPRTTWLSRQLEDVCTSTYNPVLFWELK